MLLTKGPHPTAVLARMRLGKGNVSQDTVNKERQVCIGSNVGVPNVEVEMSILDTILIFNDYKHCEASNFDISENNLNIFALEDFQPPRNNI